MDIVRIIFLVLLHGGAISLAFSIIFFVTGAFAYLYAGAYDETKTYKKHFRRGLDLLLAGVFALIPSIIIASVFHQI
jgi:hypothetical protein